MRRNLAILVLALFAPAGRAQDGDPSRAAEAFFEKQIRPVLAEHCVGCHGPKKQQGGLRFDADPRAQKGSDDRPIIVPGQPEKSRLLEVLRHDGEVKMPPKGKLPAPAIAALTAWVKAGAPWPKALAATGGEAARKHWAFQPVRRPVVPSAKHDPSSPVDAFLLAQLEAKGLEPGGPADWRTLIRRATFDLHGLPPTPAEVDDFLRDASAKPQAAWGALLERLLASPRYGERWGRYWLDVARYSDTKGYVRLADNPRYVGSWTYRDWVIRAFNEDLPYDQFIVQQLAADRMPLGEDRRPLAAMGFLTLGQRFINSKHDIIDDRIDVVTRGFLGLTVTCARCHDHKFDPVSIRDYYALHGVFASSIEPRVPPLILPPGDEPRHGPYLKELKARTGKFERFLHDEHAKMTADFRARAADYLLAAHKSQVQANFTAPMFLVDVTRELNPVMEQRWGRFLEQTRKSHHPVFAPWHMLAALPAAESTTKAPVLIAGLGGKGEVNQVVVDALSRRPPRNLTELAARYGELFAEADRRWQKAGAAPQLGEPAWEQIRRVLYGPDAPPDVPEWDMDDCFFVDTTAQNRFHAQQRPVEDWIGSPGAAPHAAILVDAPEPTQPRVFLRGNASNPGEAVPRRFLEVLSRGPPQPFKDGSGRLELARAIAAKDNPLTARVIVNRVWMHHFGAGLVRTPSDFGLRGDPPTHPELLDYLAWRFMEDGWSLKKLHRLIMLSAAYQRQCADTAKGRELDPENTLLWKMNRRRLDWEALRDALLSASGGLSSAMGGPSVDLTAKPFTGRRTVYGFIDRQNLASVFRTFDFVPPEASSPQRHQTTVPQQALFLMNSPFLKEQVRKLAARPELRDQPVERRVDFLHRLLYGRLAEAQEIALARRYLDVAPAPPPGALTAWEEYVQVLLLANEFTFVD